MRRPGVFIGLFIVLLGAVLLAINLGYVSSRIWGFFWPALLVLMGAWILLAPKASDKPLAVEHATYSVGEASEGEISFHYGAGVLHIADSTTVGELAGGTFTGGVLADQSMRGSTAVLSLKFPSDRIIGGPWGSRGKAIEWVVGINPQLPLTLALHTGANEQILDLSRTQVKNLLLETGASHSMITLPSAAGFTRAIIKSGVADVNITVPEGVAAAIDVHAGLSGIKVNSERFPKTGDHYQSMDYLTAVNKVEIHVESGLGSVSIQ